MNIIELHRSVFNFRFSLCFIFCVKIGLFDLIKDRSLSVAEVEEYLHIKRGRGRALLEMLCAHGVLSENSERYRLAESLVPAFSEKNQNSFRNLLVFDSLNLKKWTSLEGTFFDEGSCPAGGISVEETFSKAMEERIMQMHERVADIIAIYARKSVADVGCGPGSAIDCLIKRTDEIHCYLIDKPSVLDATSRKFKNEHGELWNVECIPVDVLNSRIPVQVSVVLASRVLMGYVRPDLEKVIENLVFALEPNGILIVNEFNPETRVGSLMSLDAMVNAGSIILRGNEYAELMGRYGMKLEERIPTSSFTHALCFRKNMPDC